MKKTTVSLCLVFLSCNVMAEARLQDQSLMKSLVRIDEYYSAVRDKLNSAEADGQKQLTDETEAYLSPAQPTAFWQLPAPQDPADFSDAGTRIGYRDGKRNPFAPTRQIIAALPEGSGSRLNFQPVQQATKIPRMHLKGLINEGGGETAALLEIENVGTYIVREGDTVGLYEAGSSSVIRVKQINRLNLVVEAGSLGQVLIVR